jgi:hypothetical protein
MAPTPAETPTATATETGSNNPAGERIRGIVEERLRELRPLIAELEQLRGILELLDGAEANPDATRVSTLLGSLGIEPAGGSAPAVPASASASAVQPLLRRGRRGTRPGRDGRAPQGANKQRIIAKILERPGIGAAEIAEATGLKRTVVSATISRLKRTGELESHGEGVRVPLLERGAVA